MESSRHTTKLRKAMLVCGAFAPEPCGVGDYTGRLASSLEEEGCEVHVLTSTKARSMGGFRVHAAIDDWTDLRETRRKVLELVDGIRPDVVQVQYPGSFGPANRSLAGNLLPLWIRSRGVRVCTTLHEWGERKLQWRLRAAFMALGSDALVAVTSSDARLLAALPIVGRRPVRHVPIGSNLDFGYETAPVAGVPVLAYFGFLHPLKGVRELVETAAALRRRGVGFRLDLHGHFHPEQDSHHAEIRSQVEAAGLGESVRFPGPVPSDPKGASESFRDAVLGVLPFREGVSERRGSFLALGQAGIPVLTSPGPWRPEWLRDGENVFLEPLEAPRWAERIEHLLANRDALSPVGARLKTEIVKRHAWPAVARAHLDLWSELA